jgi:hypothetical protein
MRKFVGQQPLSDLGSRNKLTRPKYDILANGVRPSLYRLSGIPGVRIDMHAYPGEILSKPRLHERARRGVEWLAWLTQDFVDDGRGLRLPHVASSDALHLQARRFLFLAVVATAAAGAGALHTRLGHAHNLVGEAVGFLLVGVPRGVDGQLGLESQARGRGNGRASNRGRGARDRSSSSG